MAVSRPLLNFVVPSELGVLPNRVPTSVTGWRLTINLRVQMSGHQKLFGTIPRTAHARARRTKGAFSAGNERRRLISLRKTRSFS